MRAAVLAAAAVVDESASAWMHLAKQDSDWLMATPSRSRSPPLLESERSLHPSIYQKKRASPYQIDSAVICMTVYS